MSIASVSSSTSAAVRLMTATRNDPHAEKAKTEPPIHLKASAASAARPEAVTEKVIPVAKAKAAATSALLSPDAAALAAKVTPAMTQPAAEDVTLVSGPLKEFIEANPEALEDGGEGDAGDGNMLTVKGLMAAWGQNESPYDLNGDGTVDLSDLLTLLQNGGTMPMPETASEPLTLEGLLAAWGTSNTTFDLNGDGTVDTSDLLALLAQMGDAPADEEKPGAELTLKGLMGAWGQNDSPYDLNGDGTVDLSDLLLLMQNGGTMPMPEGANEPLTLDGLLAAWGTSNPAFDLNGDGTVDVSDLLMLMSKMGSGNSEMTGIASADLPEGMTSDQLLALARASPAATEKSISDLLTMLSDKESA